jgi:hypothetical protein
MENDVNINNDIIDIKQLLSVSIYDQYYENAYFEFHTAGNVSRGPGFKK